MRSKASFSTTILLHIGTGGVRAGIAITGGDPPARLIWSTYRAIPVAETLDPAVLTKTLVRAADDALCTLQKSGLQYMHEEHPDVALPRTMLCVLSPAWYAGHTRIISFKQQKSFLVTADLIDKLTQRTAAKLGSGTDHTVLEEGFSWAKVNGYATTAPIGKRGRELEIAFHLSSIDSSFARKLHDLGERIFHLPEPVHIHSQAFAAFTVFRDVFDTTGDFTIVDVGAEVTELAVVLDETLARTTSIPVGARTLARTIAANSGTIPDAAMTAVRGAAHESLGSWKTAFDEAVEGLRRQGAVPPVFYILAEDPYAAALAHLLDDEERETHAVRPADLQPLAISKTSQKLDAILLTAAAFASRLAR